MHIYVHEIVMSNKFAYNVDTYIQNNIENTICTCVYGSVMRVSMRVRTVCARVFASKHTNVIQSADERDVFLKWRMRVQRDYVQRHYVLPAIRYQSLHMH